MCRVPRIVTAALLGAIPIGLLVAGSTLTSSSRGAVALVTLQVAPRAPSDAGASVSAVVVAPPQPAPSPCNDSTESTSCEWSFQAGTTVRLTATAGNAAFKFAGWSIPECPGISPCTLTLDDDYTSLVALFNPLSLGVRFSHREGVDPPADRHVTSKPAGIDCTPTPESPDGDGIPGCTHLFDANTDVELTVEGSNFAKWAGSCTPETERKCTIRVDDYTSWAGAIYDTGSPPEDPPQLAQTIEVQFQLRKGGGGSGAVTAPNINCGSQCSAKFLYGKSIALTETPTGDSVFDGWGGVCARTQRTCRFAVGPITRVKALFARDSTPPSAPADLRTTDTTRTSISIAWGASSDNLRVKGYRIYLADASVADVTTRQYTLSELKCASTYDVAVDAVDGAGNRSRKARTEAKTKLCALSVNLLRVRVLHHGRARSVVARLRTNRSTSARLTLKRRGRSVAGRAFKVHAGSNLLRLRVRPMIPAGRYRLRIAVRDPDGGRARVLTRQVRLPKVG